MTQSYEDLQKRAERLERSNDPNNCRNCGDPLNHLRTARLTISLAVGLEFCCEMCCEEWLDKQDAKGGWIGR